MGTTTARLLAAGTVGGLATLALSLAVAGAAPTSSKVQIKDINPDRVKGVVTSPTKACEKGRKVNLFYEPSAPKRGGAIKLGSTKTNKAGKWTVTGAFVVGHYRAVVPAKQLSSKRNPGKLEEELTEVEDDPEEDEPNQKRSKCSKTTYSTDE